MNFWKYTVTALVISTASMLAGSHIHALAVDGDSPVNRPLQLNYLPVLKQAGTKSQTIQLSPELRAALINEIQTQTQAPIMNAVIVITPQGEVRYMGTVKNSQSAEYRPNSNDASPTDAPPGSGQDPTNNSPGPGGWAHTPERPAQEEWNAHDGPGPGGWRK